MFIAPITNLTADPGLDWFGHALSTLAVARTAGIGHVQTLGSSEIGATHRLEGYFSESGGTLHVRTSLRDLQSQQVVSTSSFRGPASEVLRISEELATRIAGRAKPYSTSSAQAIRMLNEAASYSEPDEILKHIDAALAADPAFGSAHLARIQLLLAANRRDEASEALRAASASSVKLTDEEQLKLADLRGAASGDTAGRARSALALAKLRPGDLQSWRTAAELALLVKDFPGAIEAYKSALEIEPGNVALWNTLGYAHAYAGDLASSKKALEEYRRLAPEDANAFDSLGEVHYYLGRFAEAEKYFIEAFEKNKALLGGGEALRAAMSRLMMGDRAAADQHVAKYFEVRKASNDAYMPVREAIWQFYTGRRSQAIGALEKIDNPAEVAAAARLLLTLWHMQFGDTARAQASALASAKFAQSSPRAAPAALTARFVIAPLPSSQDVAALAAKADPLRRQLLGYSLLLHGKYDDAAKLWKQVYDNTTAVSSQEERILLAWAEAERGNTAETATLMRAYALPPAGLEPNLTTILFPRSIFLKALGEQHAKNQQEAVRLFKLFLEYSGDRDFTFGEEKRAREALH